MTGNAQATFFFCFVLWLFGLDGRISSIAGIWRDFVCGLEEKELL